MRWILQPRNQGVPGGVTVADGLGVKVLVGVEVRVSVIVAVVVRVEVIVGVPVSVAVGVKVAVLVLVGVGEIVNSCSKVMINSVLGSGSSTKFIASCT